MLSINGILNFFLDEKYKELTMTRQSHLSNVTPLKGFQVPLMSVSLYIIKKIDDPSVLLFYYGSNEPPVQYF